MELQYCARNQGHIYIYIFLLFHNSTHKVHVQKSIQLLKLWGIECPHVTSTQIKKQNITRILGDLPCAPSKHQPLPWQSSTILTFANTTERALTCFHCLFYKWNHTTFASYCCLELLLHTAFLRFVHSVYIWNFHPHFCMLLPFIPSVDIWVVSVSGGYKLLCFKLLQNMFFLHTCSCLLSGIHPAQSECRCSVVWDHAKSLSKWLGQSRPAKTYSVLLVPFSPTLVYPIFRLADNELGLNHPTMRSYTWTSRGSYRVHREPGLCVVGKDWLRLPA